MAFLRCSTSTYLAKTLATFLRSHDVRGRYNYMLLETSSKIEGRVVAELPLTLKVIERVESLGLQ